MSQPLRAYLPATMTTLARLRDQGALPPGPAYAVTPELRATLASDLVALEWISADGASRDQEEWEYAAFQLAAQASLELLRAEPAAPRRRVVISVDAPVLSEPDGAARLTEPVPRPAVVAIHVDDPAAAPAVAAALAGAESDVEDELAWYDVSELDQLLG